MPPSWTWIQKTFKRLDTTETLEMGKAWQGKLEYFGIYLLTIGLQICEFAASWGSRQSVEKSELCALLWFLEFTLSEQDWKVSAPFPDKCIINVYTVQKTSSVFVLVHCLKLLELPAEFGLKDLNDCCSFFHWQRVETCELATSLRRACEWKARDEQQILGMHSSLNEVLQKETPGTCATNVFCSGNLSQFWWIFLEHPEASGPRRAPSCP